MISHKFAVGDRVQLRLANDVDGMPEDIYTISRRLPAEANVCQYRVRRVQDGQERVMRENALVMMTSKEEIGRAHMKEVETQLDLQRIRNTAARVRARAGASRSQGR